MTASAQSLSSHQKRWWVIAFAICTTLLATLTSAPTAAAGPVESFSERNHSVQTLGATPYCGITWGSLAKAADGGGYAGTVENVRAGQQACFDRLVIDLGSSGPVSYDVRYVSQVVQDGSGLPISLAGGAYLQIVLQAAAYDDDGPTFAPTTPGTIVGVSGFSTFRQVAWAGSFEGQSTIGVGVRARLPFRVLTLDGPAGGSRLVIDVAHRW